MNTEDSAKPPVPHLTIEPPSGWNPLNMREVWQARELIWFFTMRDIKARYKQSALGPLWIILIPLATSGLFSLIFGVLADMPSGEVPYPVFVFSGMLAWNLFSRSLSAASGSLRASQSLIDKVYFPRLTIPIAASCGALLDFALGFGVLTIILLIVRISPSWSLLLLPFFILLPIVTGLGVGLWIAALGLRFRDILHSTGIMTRFWMWVTPVAYSGRLLLDNQGIPEAWQPLLHGLFQVNPTYLVVEGFRWSILGAQAEPLNMLSLASLLITGFMLFTGIHLFRRTETTFADIV